MPVTCVPETVHDWTPPAVTPVVQTRTPKPKSAKPTVRPKPGKPRDRRLSAPAICTLSDRLEAALEDGRIDLTPAELKLLVMILCPETEGGEQGKWLEDLRAMLAKHRDRKQRGRPATKPAASPTA